MRKIALVGAAALLGGKPPLSRHNTELLANQNSDNDFPWLRRDFMSVSSLASITQLFTSLTEPAGATDAANAADEKFALLDPIIPFSSRRQYKNITLSNGLKVLLVNDNKSVRASAALTISGAGQFQEESDLGGMSHLLEHMVSSASKEDFEDWLSDFDGGSNAFTGPSIACYHFNVPPEYFSKSLGRFSELFQQNLVEKVCRNEAILKREIKRVNSELDFENEFARIFYVIKSLINPLHPFSRFTQGSIASLERIPKLDRINVGERLVDFFKERYQPSRAVLVVIAPAELDSLERWVNPFSTTLSQEKNNMEPQRFPPPLKYGMKPAQYIVWHPKETGPFMENQERLSLNWLLERNYDRSETIITSTTVAFFISQLIARRGPGSLYSFLLRRGWVPEGNQGLPKITLPIDISSFQLMRLEIILTVEGFLNRAAVVAAIYDCLQGVISVTQGSFNLPMDLLRGYVSMARIHGYNTAPRPSDAVELAVDAQLYGLGGYGVGVPGLWPLLQSIDGTETELLQSLQKAISETLAVIVEPKFAVILATASNNAILQSRNSLFYETIPSPLDSRWDIEAISHARYLSDDLMSLTGKVEEWIGTRLDEDALIPPKPNPLLPLKLRPPRQNLLPDGTRRLNLLGSERDSFWSKRKDASAKWQLYQTTGNRQDALVLPLPAMPEENTCKCSLLIQLLSQRPARANVNQAALAQLWLFSFEDSIKDLAELGVPAGLAYELTFNKFGLRICFLGISQNLAPYARRFSRRLINHHNKLMFEKEIETSVTEKTVTAATKQRSMSNIRKKRLEKEIHQSSPQEVSREGKAFLASSAGALCLVQGDLLNAEAESLILDLQEVFDSVRSKNEEEATQPAIPKFTDILYTPFWKPRSSLCSIPGVPLISDACGRVPR